MYPGNTDTYEVVGHHRHGDAEHAEPPERRPQAGVDSPERASGGRPSGAGEEFDHTHQQVGERRVGRFSVIQIDTINDAAASAGSS